MALKPLLQFPRTLVLKHKTPKPPRHPEKYHLGLERPDPSELDYIASLKKSCADIQNRTFSDMGHGLRSVHAKSNALMQGRIRIHDDLPAQLRQGLFAHPVQYPVIMRLSTLAGDVLNDSVSLPRGMAIKVIGVVGERLEGTDGNLTQDFLLGNGTTFGSKDAGPLTVAMRFLAGTTDRFEGTKALLSAINEPINRVLGRLGRPSRLLALFGGYPHTQPLGDTYYSQVPFLYGKYMAKFALIPASVPLRKIAGKSLPEPIFPDALRDINNMFLKTNGGQWHLCVQLCTNTRDMPIENGKVEWSTKKSEFVPVATLTVMPQTAWNDARSTIVDDGMAFSAWQGLSAHRPLGSINRTRRAVYDYSATLRAAHGNPIAEPTSEVYLPD